MMERLLLIFWGVWLLLILVAAFRVFGFNTARRRQERRWRKGSRPRQPVVLIVAVKGFDLQTTPRFFDSIFAQNYEDYRVIVTFESWDDPVALWLAEHLEVGPRNPVWTHPEVNDGLRSITLVCAGLAENEGQKVHNQIAAFRDLTGDDAIIAFADADIACGQDWLARLVAPINQGTHPLSTTYRWLVPKRPTLPNQLASVINASITTQGGNELTNVLWGGSMAIARPVFDSLDVPALFAGSLNDDLRLSKAARKAGNRIAFVRSLILPTMVDFTWGGFFEFVKRQYTQVKFFSPILYTGINLVLGFYVLGALSIAAALIYGYFYAWIPVAAAYVIDQFRALARQQVYLSLFPENGIQQKLFAASWLEHMLTPFWMGLHWLLLASTWTQDKLIWAGIRYRIRAVNKTQILGRPASVATLPAGAPGLAMLGALLDGKRGSYTQPITAIETFHTDQSAIEEPVTFTVVDENAAEVAIAATEEVATESISLVSPGPRVTIEAPPRLPHPGGPGAVIPLTTTLYDRSRRYREVAKASDRGASSAIEVALSKTRVQTPVRFPVRATMEKAAAPALGHVSRHPYCGGGIAAALSASEIVLTKTRLEGAVLPVKFRPAHSPDGVIRTRARALLGKTRVRPVTSFPVPAAPPTAPPKAPSAAPAPATSAPTTSAPAPMPTAPPPTRLFPAGKSRSLAARRANSGGSGNLRSGSGAPARSSRAAQASRAAGCRPDARPVNRRASGRP
jgi:hypothetical protein